MSKQEFVEVTVKFPKGIVDFLKDMGENVEEYIVSDVVEGIASGLDADAWADPKYWVEKHNLMPIFLKYTVKPSDYITPKKKKA